MSRNRIFLAHPKDCDNLPGLVEATRQLMVRSGKPDAVVTTGEADFALNFQRFGGWEGWAHSVASGREYHMGLPVPRFDAIVVAPSAYVGRATQSIVRLALSASKPIFHFDGMQSVWRVYGVEQVARGDFKTGWRLHLG